MCCLVMSSPSPAPTPDMSTTQCLAELGYTATSENSRVGTRRRKMTAKLAIIVTRMEEAELKSLEEREA